MTGYDDPRERQKHTAPDVEVASFMGRFLMTFVVLILITFSVAYIIGLGAFDIGGVAFTFVMTLAFCVALVIIGARALSSAGE